MLANRLLGYDAQLATCRGDLPRFAGAQGDGRYLEIAERLRRWRDEGFWMKQFSASKWPGAQRDFGAGKCTFLLTGTWLPAEIARTRSYDPAVFDLSCFLFPACPGGAGSQRSISAVGQGHAITRQGKNHKGAAALLDYLSAYGAELTSGELHYISARKGIAFPAEMTTLESVFAEAKAGDIITNGLPGEAPLCYKFVLMETFNKFFPIRSDNLSPEECVEMLESKAQQLYKRYGKGE
jgi:ABC-type glycerol-3-phosphate transport system substrate-binding protein